MIDIIVLILVNISSLIIIYDIRYKDYETDDIFEIKFTITIYYVIIVKTKINIEVRIFKIYLIRFILNFIIFIFNSISSIFPCYLF